MFGGFRARVRGGDVEIAVTGAETNPTVDGYRSARTAFGISATAR